MQINKRKKNIIILFVLLLGLSIGFALLQANLKINGTSKVKGSSWDIHFENLNVTEGSVVLSTGDVAAAIQSSTTDITYTVTLNLPGDFYEFTVDAVNAGSVDGMIESVTSKLNNQPITTLPNYLNYSITYSDGVALSPNQYLKAGDSETYKVRVEFKRDIESTELPSTAQTLTFNFGVVYIQADSNAVERPIHTFADDSWETITTNVHNGTIPSYYTVGSTKEVDLGTFGTHILRISNITTPTECSTVGFSQTACGIVLEFADIITLHNMNSTGTNAGGWPASEMRTYVNNDIFNVLPSVIRNNIIDTTVVSGHGSTTGETNFTSTDKLYLLSTKEVGFNSNWDTAIEETRTLDYYISNNNNIARVKKYNNEIIDWWLRAPTSIVNESFSGVNSNGGGSYNVIATNNTFGVSPAFRIG